MREEYYEYMCYKCGMKIFIKEKYEKLRTNICPNCCGRIYYSLSYINRLNKEEKEASLSALEKILIEMIEEWKNEKLEESVEKSNCIISYGKLKGVKYSKRKMK